jgi:hypothetical protein
VSELSLGPLDTVPLRPSAAFFPPEQVAEVKAIGCELPVTHGLPLSRFTRTELHRRSSSVA